MTDVAPAPDEGDPLRTELLEAAARVFAREGYEGTKIMDIVREAGLSTGAVYGRFRSKNDLLREAVVNGARRQAPVDLTDIDRVAELVERVALDTDRPLSDADAVHLEAMVAARREPEVAAALADFYERRREHIEPLVQTAMVDGTLDRDVDPEAVLFFVRTMHLGLLLHRGSGLPGPDARSWEDLVSRMVASFGRPTPDQPLERETR